MYELQERGAYYMKVYVVLGELDYEGFLEPYGIFDSAEKAGKHIDILIKQHGEFVHYSIKEYEIEW